MYGNLTTILTYKLSRCVDGWQSFLAIVSFLPTVILVLASSHGCPVVAVMVWLSFRCYPFIAVFSVRYSMVGKCQI
jgi:hypothetical protein